MPGRKQVCRIPRGRATAYRCRAIGIFEVLEPRLPLSASSINDRPYIDVGPSDNVAWDQPRVTVQLLTQDFPDGSEPPQDIIVGPSTFNGWLLDTGANTTLGFQTAVTDMSQFAPVYQTDGKFNELGVGGVELFDVSIPYRFDFAGSTTYERNKLLESRIISNPDRDVSIFGPWGIVGMPAMTERITTVDFTPWTNVQGFDLFMQTDFPAELPDPLGPRFTLPVDNRVRFSPEGSVVSGPGIPMWADLPFLTGELKNNESLTSGNFLFDTGAQVSILSQQLAFDLGLDSNNDGVLNSLDANFARTETIGGIAGQTTVPVFLIDEVHIPTEEGADLVWTDLQWVILDIVEGIDGVFGFDNLTSGWIEAFGVDGQSGYILQSHFDFRNWEATGQGKIYFDFNETLFTLVDPLGPGAIITESGGSTTVTEDGSVADTYEIRLSQRPTADVTVSFVGGNNQVGAVDDANPNSHFVVFTPQDWNVPKKVRAVATNDSVQEGYHRAFLRHVSSSTDANYDGVGMPRVSVGIVDDDFAGMMIIPTDGDTVVTEGGEPDYYDIVLTTAPVSEVYILINHIAGQVTAVSDADGSGALIFTPDNWYVPQTVRVTAIDDTIEEPLLPAYISHTIGSVDESYQQAFALQERAFVRDNDSTDQVGPKITDVIVSSSTWSPEFINAVDGVGEGNGLGVSVVGAHQLDNLPWNTIDKIYIQFDESVAADFSASNIQLTGINTPSYDSKLSMAFGVDGENVGTITFSSPITSDVLSLTLSDSIRDAAGNRLDGDWSNGVSLVSGNGSNGGSFNFRIEALPGDVDDSGGVTFVDVFAALSQSGALVTSPELSRLDIDGNGGINLIDVFAIYNRNGQILPSADSGSGSGSALSAGSKGAPDQSEANGVFGTTILPGYGGIAQAVTPGGRPAAELDRINPFLRRALMRAESLVQSEANLVSQLKETSADGNLSQSIPAIDSYFRQTENSLALSADHVFGRLGSAPLYQGVRSDLKVSPLDAMRSHGQIESSQLLADDSVLLTDDDSANEDVESRPLESASLAIDSSLRLRRNHSLGSYSLPGRE